MSFVGGPLGKGVQACCATPVRCGVGLVFESEERVLCIAFQAASLRLRSTLSLVYSSSLKKIRDAEKEKRNNSNSSCGSKKECQTGNIQRQNRKGGSPGSSSASSWLACASAVRLS